MNAQPERIAFSMMKLPRRARCNRWKAPDSEGRRAATGTVLWALHHGIEATAKQQCSPMSTTETAKEWWNRLTAVERQEALLQMSRILDVEFLERINWDLPWDQLGPKTQQGPLKTYHDARINQSAAVARPGG